MDAFLLPGQTSGLTETTYTTWYNAYAGGTTFTAQNSLIITSQISTSTFFYEPYVFPGLKVASLTPGEIVVMVILRDSEADVRVGQDYLPLTVYQ